MFGGKQSKLSVGIGVAALICVAGWWMAVLVGLFADAVREGYSARQSSIRILSETDHYEVLASGRELLRMLQEEEERGRSCYFRHGTLTVAGGGQPPEGLRLPRVISELAPSVVRLDPFGFLEILIHSSKAGGLGILVYPEDFIEPVDDFQYGDRMLVEGLWYFDTEYRDSPERHDRVIDRRLERNKKMRQQQR